MPLASSSRRGITSCSAGSSLTARAVSLRRRELADLEGQAGERSQSMLVAQMFLVAGFLVFLVFPVVGVLLGVQGH